MKDKRVTIKLDKPRTLILGLKAVALFEFNMKKAFFLKETWDHLSDREGIFLFFACLAEEDNNLKPEDVLQMLLKKNIKPKEIKKKVTALWAELINSLSGGK